MPVWSGDGKESGMTLPIEIWQGSRPIATDTTGGPVTDAGRLLHDARVDSAW